MAAGWSSAALIADSLDAAAASRKTSTGTGASRTRLAGHLAEISPRERACDGVRLVARRSTRKTIRLAARIVGSVIVTRSTHGSSPAGPLVARRSSTTSCGEPGKSDAMWPSGPSPSSSRSSSTSCECVVELVGGLGRRQLAADPVHLGRRRLEPVEQGLGREPVVRALVVGRDASLVAPPERDAAPVRLERCRQLVRAAAASSRR